MTSASISTYGCGSADASALTNSGRKSDARLAFILYFSLPDRVPLTRRGERRELEMKINCLIASFDALPVVVGEQLIERCTRRVVIAIQFSLVLDEIRRLLTQAALNRLYLVDKH
jgi:hypothetical protein